MSKGCLWSLLLLSVDEGECEEYFSFWSHRKTVRKHYMRPRTPHQARSQCWIAPGTPHSQRLLTGLRGLRVGLLMLLFWFLPRPGTFAICDSCILALRWLWPLFISDFFLFFFQWISSCFSRYSTWMKKRRYCLKVSWTCSRSGTSCSRLGRGTSLCTRGWLYWCKWNPQTIQSMVCQYYTGIEETCREWKQNVSWWCHSCHSAGNG